MSTFALAARARPCTIIPFPLHRARRVVPAPGDFDPFDDGIALAQRQLRAALCRDGWPVSETDALIADLLAHCVVATHELTGGAL